MSSRNARCKDEDVENRPRFGNYSPARTGSAIQKIAEGSAGQAPAERGSLRQRGGLRQQGSKAG
jgi:hypothetical protein